jgi:hypothetical protein
VKIAVYRTPEGNKSDNINRKLKHGWKRLTANWRPYIDQAIPLSEINDMMRRSSIPLLVMFGSIATFGLLSNTASAIIGAMIITPLMAPTMSLAHGLVIARYARIIRSVLTIFAGIMVVVGLSYMVTELIGIGIADSEILSRTQPILLDLGVAIGKLQDTGFVFLQVLIGGRDPQIADGLVWANYGRWPVRPASPR